MTHESNKSPPRREKHQKGVENQTTNERVRKRKKHRQDGGPTDINTWEQHDRPKK